MDDRTKNHSKFLLMCHLILVCKYRNKYIHLLIQYEPKVSILEIVRRLGQMTTFHMWKQHETYLSKHVWKERTFWSDGSFACSIGNVSKEIIQTYIQEQG